MLDQIIERNPHMVHVIQEKRALRDEARRVGIDFLVGDPECACDHARDGHHDEKGACSVKGCDCKKYRVPRANKKAESQKSQSHGLYISLEKSTKGEDVYPHKYVEKYTTPSGNVVYIYTDDLKHGQGPKSTGFEGEPQKMPPLPEIGKKRARMAQETEGADPKAREYILGGLAQRESTQRAMSLAVKFLGGPEQFEAELGKVMKANPHLDDVKHKHYAVEALARSVLLAHPEIDVAAPHAGEKSITGQFKNKAGGVMHPDENQRQPWQLGKDQFAARQGVDPALEGKSHEDVVKDAHERGEFIPAKVLEDVPSIKEDYLEGRGKLDLSPETEEYVSKFDKLVEGLPTTFDSWVKPDLKNLGDDLLVTGKTSGYNIDSYEVTDRGIYSHMMTADKDVVLYHMYAQHAGHGREMLALMHENGLDPQYTVVKRASAVQWDDAWGKPDKEMTTRDLGGGKKIAYSSDYILAFKPSSKEQADEIYKTLAKHGNMNKDHAIPHSYYVPDVRSSKKIDDFEKVYLNIFPKGSQELTVLTKNDWIREEGPAVSKEVAQKKESREYKKGGMLRENVWIERKLSREEQKKPEGEQPAFLAQVIKSQRNEFGEVLLVRID